MGHKKDSTCMTAKFGGKNLHFRILEALSYPLFDMTHVDLNVYTTPLWLSSSRFRITIRAKVQLHNTSTHAHQQTNHSQYLKQMSTPSYLAHLFAITLVVVKSMFAMMDSLGMSTIEGRLVTTVCQALPLPGYRMAPGPSGCCALCVCLLESV